MLNLVVQMYKMVSHLFNVSLFLYFILDSGLKWLQTVKGHVSRLTGHSHPHLAITTLWFKPPQLNSVLHVLPFYVFQSNPIPPAAFSPMQGIVPPWTVLHLVMWYGTCDFCIFVWNLQNTLFQPMFWIKLKIKAHLRWRFLLHSSRPAERSQPEDLVNTCTWPEFLSSSFSWPVNLTCLCLLNACCAVLYTLDWPRK